jgi:hypothetical protein
MANTAQCLTDNTDSSDDPFSKLQIIYSNTCLHIQTKLEQIEAKFTHNNNELRTILDEIRNRRLTQ